MDKEHLIAAGSARRRIDTVNAIAQLVFVDAEQHNLYDFLHADGDEEDQDQLFADRIMEEVRELRDAAGTREKYAELADVIIMCLSYAGYQGIDIGYWVEQKRLDNISRPDRHKEEQR